MQLSIHDISKKQPLSRPGEVFLYLLGLTLFLLFIEVSYFIQCNQSYLSDYGFVARTLHIPASVWWAIAFFILVELLIHVVYVGIVWGIVLGICNLLTVPRQRELTLIISCWAVLTITLMLANQVFYPNSKFSDLTYLLFNASMARYLLFVFGIVSLGLCAMGAIGVLRHYFKIGFITIFLIFFYVVFNYFFSAYQNTHDASTFEKPNIILVGVDSLRPDALSYFGSASKTPFFDHFLNRAAVFTQTLTPIARTFPAWISILTGQYPIHHSARTNLSLQNKIPKENTLPALLKKEGYETIFATDETRFSNITTVLGFDRVISPPIGLNDFLIGTFNDFPLSNLLINTPIGRYLFPFSYANRPVYFTYQPNSFLQLIKPALSQSRQKPLFFAIHFCITHYPYLSANVSGRDVSILKRYQQSVTMADVQLQSFFQMLSRYHLLDHAIVVLLSDHGEALEIPGDRITNAALYEYSSQKKLPVFYPASEDAERVDESAGHGTDVLGLSQYHSLLAFRSYATAPIKPQQETQMISLLDIKPTVLALIGAKPAVSDGDSLATRLIHPKASFNVSLKPIFLESDFSPAAIRTVYPKLDKVVLDGLKLFQIDPISTRLYVKPAMNRMIIESKQYAVVDRGWILALYPKNKHQDQAILVDLNTGEWTDHLDSPFAKKAPISRLTSELNRFYGHELKPY